MQMSSAERRALYLGWGSVCEIMEKEIKEILCLDLSYKTNPIGIDYWDVQFKDYRLPLPKLCRLLHSMEATQEEWEASFPDEGDDVTGISMALAEKLLSRNLGVTWIHSLVTEKGLWLVGVSDSLEGRGKTHEGSGRRASA